VFVLMGALGMITKRLHFLTNVFVLPLRNPLIVARALGTASVLCGEGRIELGVGVGHLRDEFLAADADFDSRGPRTDEAIEILRAVLRPGAVSHHGKFWNFGPIYMHPAPAGPPPIFIGGESKPALRRAALLGDGHTTVGGSMEHTEGLIKHLNALRKELNPDAAPLAYAAQCPDASTPDDFRRLADLGVSIIRIGPWQGGAGYAPPPLADRLDGMARFQETVISKLGDLIAT
jgi:alkanesulfonate monooxygenase SsuD/methylene tetrahydromethanopterin reductase-like flavin-dependent oxidoreductase (luciferase family)